MTPQEQIKQEAERRYPINEESWVQEHTHRSHDAFIEGANYRQPEIDRLNELLEDHHKKTVLANWPEVTKSELEESWEYYKQQHNI